MKIFSIIILALLAVGFLWLLSVVDEDLYRSVCKQLIKLAVCLGVAGAVILWAMHQLALLFS